VLSLEEENNSLLHTMIMKYLEVFREINRKFEFKDEELTRQDIRLLEYVHKTEDCNMTNFIEYFEIENPSKATRYIDKLVKNDFIERKPSKTDRRKVILELTPKATEFITKRNSVIYENFLQVFSKLSDEELKQQITILDKLVID
jgi:DNA-binding MarR family transcriptional regulator